MAHTLLFAVLLPFTIAASHTEATFWRHDIEAAVAYVTPQYDVDIAWNHSEERARADLAEAMVASALEDQHAEEARVVLALRERPPYGV
jgi:hypothetical protein